MLSRIKRRDDLVSLICRFAELKFSQIQYDIQFVRRSVHLFEFQHDGGVKWLALCGKTEFRDDEELQLYSRCFQDSPEKAVFDFLFLNVETYIPSMSEIKLFLAIAGEPIK